MDYNIHVSNGNTKLGGVANFSLTPIASCRDGVACKKGCYALRSYRRMPTVRMAWDENTKLVQKNLYRFENLMNAWIDANKPTMFRIHVAGDFISKDYLMSWVRIIKRHPDTNFFCFTKQHGYIEKYIASNTIPRNFTIIASAWLPNTEGWLPPKKLLQRLPVAWVVKDKDKDYAAIRAAIGSRRLLKAEKCSGNCESCGKCFHRRKSDGDIIFDLH